MISTIYTTKPEETIALAKMLGSRLKGGEMIELSGDIGSGKTTFTKGLAAGLGCVDEVASPTFTINRVYQARDGLSLYHFDFYRLEGHDITTDELSEITDDPSVVTVIEWAGNADARLSPQRLRVALAAGPSDSEREIVFSSANPGLKDIIRSLK